MPVSRKYGYVKQFNIYKALFWWVAVGIAVLMMIYPTEVQNDPKFAPKQEIGPQEVSITDLITYHAKKANFDSQTALKIATCESQLGKYKENWENSGAIGLFQFKPSTWKNYCIGDINDDEDQIQCFIKLYPKFPHWWECKNK